MLTRFQRLLKCMLVPAAFMVSTLGFAATQPSNTFILGVATNVLPTVQQLIAASGIPQSQIDVKSGYSARLAEKADLDVAIFASPAVADQVIKKTGSQQRVTLGTPVLAAYCAHCQGQEPLEDALKSGHVSALVYANPKDAPLGKAAEEVISNLKFLAPKTITLTDPHKVMDYNPPAHDDDVIFTTAAALKSVNVDITNTNKVLLFKQSDYPGVDLTHEAILTNKGKNNATAQKFMTFLTSCSAKKILSNGGYANADKSCTAS